jgi:hypothetical protein
MRSMGSFSAVSYASLDRRSCRANVRLQEKIADYIVKCILKLQRQRCAALFSGRTITDARSDKSMVCKKEAMDNWIAYADSFMTKSVHTECVPPHSPSIN